MAMSGFGTVKLGEARSGYAEVIRNADAVDYSALKAKSVGGVTQEFSEGEWAILNASKEAVKSDSGSAEFLAYPVVTGKERFDIQASRTTALAIGTGYHLRTSGFRLDGTVTAAAYTYGVGLCVKSGKLEPAVSGEQILAVVLEGVSEVTTEADKALGETGFKTIVVLVEDKGEKA